jgi:hypothetical protein
MTAIFYDWEQEEDPSDPILESMKKQVTIWQAAVDERRKKLKCPTTGETIG